MIGPLLCLELPHFLVSLAIALILFRIYKNWWLIPLAFVTGVLIDVDHLFDYWFFTNWQGNFLEFLKGDYFSQSQKIHVLFHGWEFLPPLWLGGRLLNHRFGKKGIEWALSLSYFGHLLIDQFSGYTTNPLAYFFIYRYLMNFDLVKYIRL